MTRIVVTVPIASMLSANGRGATWHAKAAKNPYRTERTNS